MSAVRHAILELFARLPPQRCPHCRKWICSVAAAHREAVRLHWDAIERVAVALIERGELSGDEVDALIARA